jgi:hypothetical protein
MVHLPPDFVISSTLSVGTIYKFVAPELIGTTIPHYFIVVAIDGSDNYLVLCTSQKVNKEVYFQRNNLDLSGLVFIKPDLSNGFTTETYVNCNDYYPIPKSALINKFGSGTLTYTGTLSLNHYTQIKTGIINSHTNDLPHDLLVHPAE